MPLDPEFDRRIRALVTAGQSGGKSLNFESVYRSPQDQARAINSVSMNVNKRPASIVDYARGIPGYAAPVGSSMHQKGLAADLAGGGVGWARENAANYGIRFPESLRGTDPNHAEIDPKFWGPVQDPRDAAATAAAASAPPIKVAEIPARMGGTDVAPASTASPAPSAPRVASWNSTPTGAAQPMARTNTGGWTPESVDFSKKFGAGQMKEGVDSSPVGHWTQAIARVLQAGSGAAWNQQGMEAEREGNARVAGIYSNALANNEPTSRIAAQLMADPFGRAKGMALAEREPDRAMERQRMQLATNADQRAESASQRQNDLATMQMQQLKSQTPEWRQANAARFGIDIATQEGKAFVISGQYTPKSDIVNVKDNERPMRVGRDASGNPVYTPIDTGQEPGISKPKDRASVEHQLRSEITGITKDYRTVREALGSLDAIAQQDSAGADIALIFSYMKILDPNSVVRETEFATAQNAAGVPDQVRNAFNRALNGERLNPKQRQDFLGVARRIGTQQTGQYKRTIDQYRDVANRSGVDPRNVILDQDLLTPSGGVAQGNSRVGTGQTPPPNALDDARAAIAKGAPRDKVIERLRQNGIPTDGL